MRKTMIWISLLIIIIGAMTLGGLALDRTLTLRTVDAVKVGNQSVWLTGVITRPDAVSEYGFAVSDFPLPPKDGQTVNYYKVEGNLGANSQYNYLLTELEADKHYFITAYYYQDSHYTYGREMIIDTPPTIRVDMGSAYVELEETDIEIPIYITRSADIMIGQITFTYNPQELELKELKSNLSSDTNPATRTIATEDLVQIEYSWRYPAMTPLDDAEISLVFNVNETIAESGQSVIDLVTADFYNDLGEKLAARVTDGAIDYQFKDSVQRTTDKYFNENDMTYTHTRLSNTELLTVKHTNLMNYSRWMQARGYFDDNQLPVNISQGYMVDPPELAEGQLLRQEWTFSLTQSQRNDLINADCDLRYYTPLGMSFYFAAEDFAALGTAYQTWKLEFASLDQRTVQTYLKPGESLVSAWEVDHHLPVKSEVQFQVSGEYDKQRLRIRVINADGFVQDLVPYYRTNNGQELVCLDIEENVTCLLIEPNSRTILHTVGSNLYVYNNEMQPIYISYFGANNTIMLPVRLLDRAMGLNVAYRDGYNQVMIEDGREIIITGGSRVVLINQQAYLMDEAPEFKNGIFYIPIDFISEVLGGEFTYNSSDHLAQIIY